MDIEKLIERECKYRNDKDDVHDKAYEKALRNSYEKYKAVTTLSSVRFLLEMARKNFASGGSTHTNVADCMVLCEMETELE
jgi:DnaJ-domain-containing protein 1